MSYIIKSNNPFVSVKLTEMGREKLAKGALNFTNWAIGDSEIDYNRETNVENYASITGTTSILRPKDRQPDLKYFVSTGDTVLNPLNVDGAPMTTIKAVVNNQAIERGFFSGTTDNYDTLITSEYIVANASIGNLYMTGGTTIQIGSVGVSIGDYIMFKISTNTLGTLTPRENIEPTPNLWYRIESVDGTSITVDRTLPKIDSPSTFTMEYFIYPGGEVASSFGTGTTSAYWDTGTLSFVNNCNVSIDDNPVWCMNNVWSESIAGIVGSTYEDYRHFGSYQYVGEKDSYLGFNLTDTTTASTLSSVCDGISSFDSGCKALSLIHYTNNTISNMYGEFFHIDGSTNKIFELELPTLMYHRRDGGTESGDTMGMKFIASGQTKYITNTNIEYIDLIEDSSLVSERSVVSIGRVYPQLKIVSIEDPEVIAGMSYKSNRNWTLPGLKTNMKSPSGGSSYGSLETDKTMYITYALENTLPDGLVNSLPCQKYSKLTNRSGSSKDIEFIIEDIGLLPYMRKIEKVGYDGRGFYADKFKLLYQIVDSETTRPTSDGWLEVDFTSTAITDGVGETIDPILLENQSPEANGFILTYNLSENQSSQYDLVNSLNIPLITNPEGLNFGDERFFYGNLKTYIGATIYKTIFGISIGSKFNQTSNPTRGNANTNPTNIRVSEVGIYDDTNSLVCIGKLSEPIELTGDVIMIEMSLDF